MEFVVVDGEESRVDKQSSDDSLLRTVGVHVDGVFEVGPDQQPDLVLGWRNGKLNF